jgi:uncharacterized protein with PIN domain
MLGRLAKWLRMLGYDTFYDAQKSAAVLVELCAVEQRIFLTRNRNIVNTLHLEWYLVQSEHYREQLREIITRFSLDTERYLFSRCTICNTVVVPVEKESMRDVVPSQSLDSFTAFYQCPQCKRVYWEGTHVENTRKRLQMMKQMREPSEQ